jgi:hypothetical protein
MKSTNCGLRRWLVRWHLASTLLGAGVATGFAAPPPGYVLVFSDEFSGTTADLDKNWDFQNGPSGHILSSRWRENAVVTNGFLRLVARKEKRGGQEWTAGSL